VADEVRLVVVARGRHRGPAEGHRAFGDLVGVEAAAGVRDGAMVHPVRQAAPVVVLDPEVQRPQPRVGRETLPHAREIRGRQADDVVVQRDDDLPARAPQAQVPGRHADVPVVAQVPDTRPARTDHLRGAIAAPVVDHDDLVEPALEAVEVLQQLLQALAPVVRQN